MEGLKSCLDAFAECSEAILAGELIKQVSATDKEFHFQNWFRDRLENAKLNYHDSGRNTYPDFPLVRAPIGFEVKGLRVPGRWKNYDCNSQVPSGRHNGMDLFYVFGRYPAPTKRKRGEPVPDEATQYPVIDLVMCHGDFMNATREYEHRNENVKGFGSYGDIMIRDRKMYVAPTPFALTNNTEGLRTLILPAGLEVDARFKAVGALERIETPLLVTGYAFDLTTNRIEAQTVPNPNAGTIHSFAAYRITADADRKVTMVDPTAIAHAVDNAEEE